MLRFNVAYQAKARFEVAIRLLLFVVVVGVIYRYCWGDFSDPYKCGALLNKGQWLDPSPRRPSQNNFRNWQPPGCIMHEYKKRDIRDCFQKQRIVFVGDSTTRQVFWAVAEKLDQERADLEVAEMLDSKLKHRDLEFVSDGVAVQFIWDPWLNSTALEWELKKFKTYPSRDEARPNEELGDSPGSILLGAPRDSVDAVIPFMDHNLEDQAVLTSPSISNQKQPPNLLLLAPVQVPWYESLSSSGEETVTPGKIDQMNDYLQQVSANSYADVIWSYSLMSWAGHGTYEESGMHVIDSVAHRKADIILNLRCNADATKHGYPFDRTCCTNYVPLKATQWAILFVGMMVLPILRFFRRRHIPRLSSLLPPTNVLAALITFALVMCFCFYADRTQIFEKSQKHFQTHEFLSACVIIAIGGIFTAKRNKTSVTDDPKTSTSVEDDFMPRDQTDEWKGWMQFFILIYHYTHGSKILPIYKVVRLLVSSYLFLTGFSHTLYLLEREDYSLQRVVRVLLRLNLLSCALPFMMGTDYLFYHFASLASFWFLVIYTTLKFGSGRNDNLVFVMGKIFLSTTVTTAFTKMPGVLEFVSALLWYIFRISWNMKEWRFRAFLDMYIVYVGMITAVLFDRSRKLRSGFVSPKTNIDKVIMLIITHYRIFQVVIVSSSIAVLPGFWLLSSIHTKKEDFNWWHPYISFVPILAFIILRNSHNLLREYHSGLFAWLGRFSLETYVLQYHIWLAGDTKGLLRLGLFDRWTEAAILTPIFLWVSYSTAVATPVLTNWVLGETTSHDRAKGNVTVLKDSPYYLSNVRNGEPTPSKGIKFELRRGRIARLWSKHMPLDPYWKLVVILGIMWIGNVTYK
ncbi:hypothetical protein G7Y89_g2769 [Cudoniella acicularis]|uniref:Cas1p 10 TM acyl transferase domain-containing protein n=1 Tax=Cudoniella acicularis TaxID=354080 RepID=A0A8H4RSQ3_9HELO|nr:hypothetical protein G7Y89_g2769 [Cudoniella acicularis]